MKRNNFILILFFLISIFPSLSYADSFESLIMPGPVIKGHAKFEQKCNECHNIFDKDDQDSLCLSCHKDIRKDIEKNTGYHGKYPVISNTECNACHIEHKGRGADIVKLDKRTFQHQFTDFELKDSHNTVECSSCHLKEKKYTQASHQCNGCHKDNDIHKGKLGKKCNSCHNEKSWSDISFDHDKTDFALIGKHAKINCNSCHINNKYSDTPTKCNSCHAIDDVHEGSNGKKCSKCHNSRSWKKLKFNHNKDTDFKLTGRHKKQTCVACHPKNPYKVKIKKTCVSCHNDDDKHDNNFGGKCQTCHNTKKWKQILFDHNKDTKYRLNGKHRNTKCNDCHTSKLYKSKTPTKCMTCHKLDDVHKSKKNTDCGECHIPKSWHNDIRFDHDLTSFPLLGLHAITACNDCHQSKEYKTNKNTCIDCHKKDDSHKRKLGTDCKRCHNPNDWRVWKFNHDKETSFVLDGSHNKIHCHQCHEHPVEDNITTGQTCGVCHIDDDVHNNQFGQRCERCHNTDTFSQIEMSDI